MRPDVHTKANTSYTSVVCYMKIAKQTLSFREGLTSKPDLDAIKFLCQLRV